MGCFERGRKGERERKRERERERKRRGKHRGDKSTKRAEKVRSNIKREEGVELKTTGIPEVGWFRLCLKQNM